MTCTSSSDRVRASFPSSFFAPGQVMRTLPVEDSWNVHGGFLEDSWKVSGSFQEGSWRVHGGFLESSWRVHGGFMEGSCGRCFFFLRITDELARVQTASQRDEEQIEHENGHAVKEAEINSYDSKTYCRYSAGTLPVLCQRYSY